MVHTPSTLAAPSGPVDPGEGEPARVPPAPPALSAAAAARDPAAVGTRAGNMAMGNTDMVDGTPRWRMGGGIGTPPALDGFGGRGRVALALALDPTLILPAFALTVEPLLSPPLPFPLLPSPFLSPRPPSPRSVSVKNNEKVKEWV